MHEEQRVADMADEVLARQAVTRAGRTGERFEKLRSGAHRDERAQEWREGLVRGRAEKWRRSGGRGG